MSNEELKLLMAAGKLNAKALAEIAHVTPTAVYRWLKGSRKIPPLVVDKLLTLRSSVGKTLDVGSHGDWSVR